MEKYGVETSQGAPRCPRCGAPAERHGAVFLCPTHGSEPFEKTSTHGVESVGTGEPTRNP